jgi:NadR type nicotinamide-nucleotide adenylyltransferase
LTTAFRQWHSDAPAVAHVLVDRQRQEVPVSGTLIRGDVHRHRSWLPPVVYASFVERVCLLGGESSGKTTLAAALADSLATAWVPEYGRKLWDEKRGQLGFEDARLIAERQIAAETEAVGSANRWLFCDTSPLTTLFYSHDLFGRADPALEAMAHRPYHRTFVCAPDFPFVQDGTRRDPAFRQRQHEWYVRELRRSRTQHVIVGGTLTHRIAQVKALLASAAPRST